MNAEAYRRLVREDIEWLNTVPRTLDRDHVLLILEHQIRDADEIVKRDMQREREEQSKPVHCRYDCGWAGKCKSPAKADGFCEKHHGKKCVSCGAVAIRECDHTGIQFVCGAPLCATCQHGIPKKGNEGWFLLGGGHVTQDVYERQCEQKVGQPT